MSRINLLFVMAFMTCMLSVLSLVTIIDGIISSSRFPIFTQEFRSCAKISILGVFEFYHLIPIENRNDMKPKSNSCQLQLLKLKLNINQIYTY